jgi:D-sedoheptulose 7-phosphate isomerase
MPNRFEEILKKSDSGEIFSKKYLEHLTTLLSAIDIRSIYEIMTVLEKARGDKRKIFLLGNGGSAATASHLAEDLALGLQKRGHIPFKTVSLTDNCASITAIGNDEGYELVFMRQLSILFEKGDVVIGISASGNSPNVLRALEYANERGGITIGFSGFDGGKMKTLCRYCVHVATYSGEYEPVEDIHLVIGHLIASYFKYRPLNT